MSTRNYQAINTVKALEKKAVEKQLDALLHDEKYIVLFKPTIVLDKLTVKHAQVLHELRLNFLVTKSLEGEKQIRGFFFTGQTSKINPILNSIMEIVNVEKFEHEILECSETLLANALGIAPVEVVLPLNPSKSKFSNSAPIKTPTNINVKGDPQMKNAQLRKYLI
jgi:hypothetical protein